MWNICAGISQQVLVGRTKKKGCSAQEISCKYKINRQTFSVDLSLKNQFWFY
jgi:predicted Rossmann fold nucleotide-binding protein DprA/Smf involved in DNA uptake